jgi:hypothetical protein
MPKLVKPVHFHHRIAGRVVHTAQNRGVVSRGQSQYHTGFEIVCRCETSLRYFCRLIISPIIILAYENAV